MRLKIEATRKMSQRVTGRDTVCLARVVNIIVLPDVLNRVAGHKRNDLLTATRFQATPTRTFHRLANEPTFLHGCAECCEVERQEVDRRRPVATVTFNLRISVLSNLQRCLDVRPVRLRM